MDTETGVILANCIISLSAIIKVLVSQNYSKKEAESLESEIKILKEQG